MSIDDLISLLECFKAHRQITADIAEALIKIRELEPTDEIRSIELKLTEILIKLQIVRTIMNSLETE